MSERYSRLYSMPSDLYAEGSPVVIAAGALLKDNQTGRVLAQLKMRNISPKSIKAVKVCIQPLDTVGNLLGEKIEYQYLDLNAARDDQFGQKVPIALLDSSTRGFSAQVSEVYFSDNSVWNAGDAEWSSLPMQSILEAQIKDAELLRQYRLKYGFDCAKQHFEHKDLWFCTCGALNHSGEKCHVCHRELADLKNVDLDALRAECDARLEAERQQAEANRAAAAAKAKKNKKLALIIAPIVIVAIIASVLISNIIEKKQEEAARKEAEAAQREAYKQALAFVDTGEYEQAMRAVEMLEGYDNSEEQITTVKDKLYNKAVQLYDEKSYEESVSIFEALEPYKETGMHVSAQAAIDNYAAAVSYLENSSYENNRLAYQLLLEVGDYKDAEELLKSFEYVKDDLIYSKSDCYPSTNFPTVEFWETENPRKTEKWQDDYCWGYKYPCAGSNKECKRSEDYLNDVIRKNFSYELIYRSEGSWPETVYCDDFGNWLHVSHKIYPSHYIEVCIIEKENIPEFTEAYKAFKALW